MTLKKRRMILQAKRRHRIDMLHVLLVACTIIMAGCMIGPNYQRPAVDKPDAYRYAVKEAQDTSNLSWWRQFQDPVLDDLINESLANNKNLKIAAANIEQAIGVLTQVRSPLFPQVNYGGSAARQRGSEMNATPLSPSVSNPQNVFQTPVPARNAPAPRAPAGGR